MAEKIVQTVGGVNNIEDVTHCSTRLRLVLKNDSKANDQKLEAIDGVFGIMKKGGQLQIIVGEEVGDVYKEVESLTGQLDSAVNKEKQPKNEKGIKIKINNFFDTLSGCLTPTIPALIGGGMLKLINIILGLLNLDQTSTYRVIEIMGDTVFYFLPILLAYTASKKLKTDTLLSIVVVAVMIHPSLIELMGGKGAVTFLTLPITSATYSSSVIPAILAVWVVSKVAPLVDKITPGWTRNVIRPLLILLICIPLVLIVFGPLGAILGDGLSKIAAASQEVAPWATMMVLSAVMPLLIMTGMHHALNPIMFAGFASVGFDVLYLPAMLAPNFAQAAACLAVAFKSKNKDLKSVATTSAITALAAGVTEPALFGVTLRLKKPFIATIIGSGVAGLFVGLFHIKSYAILAPSLLSIIQFISPDENSNFIYAIIAAAISLVVTFILTLVIGFEDLEDTTKKKEMVTDNSEVAAALEQIGSPIKGQIVPLEEVDDAAFSKKMLGEGLAIIPSEGEVYAPFDGTVKVMFQTGHAIGLESDTGIELLIHVGLDTVKLEGEGFTPRVKTGDKVRKGQLLLTFDIEDIKEKGYDLITPVVITNLTTTGKKLYCTKEQEQVDLTSMLFELQ